MHYRTRFDIRAAEHLILLYAYLQFCTVHYMHYFKVLSTYLLTSTNFIILF